MKIYHTETQEDYDALMVELEAQGCEWSTSDKPTEETYWHINREKTCVSVQPEGKMRIMSKEYHNLFHPSVPTIKYKAKADEKMRFNKQNVEREFDKFIQGGDSVADLKERIINLVDEPEKAVVPKCFDEWFKEIEAKYPNPDRNKTFALWKLCQQGFGSEFKDVRGRRISYESDLGDWLSKNKFLAIDAVLNGYTIEPEQLYCIPLPHLETADGTKQYLTKSGSGNYFALSPCVGQKQRYTKEELERVPEVYKQYAKLIEEEEE